MTFPVPGVASGGVTLTSPAAFPGSTQMATIDASGNIGTQAIPSAGVAGPGSSTDYAVALWNGTLGATLRTQANLLVESGLVKVRQSGGVGGVDEMQFSHDGSNAKIETLDGDLLLRTPLNKAVRIRPATSSASNPLLVCEDASGTTRLLFDLFGYRFSVGGDFSTGVSIDGVAGDFTTRSGADVRAASYANFFLTGCTLRWPTFSADVRVTRASAGVLQIYDGSTGRASLNLLNLSSTGYHEFTEMTAPSAPAANSVRAYAEDDGAGKTRLVLKWSDGTTTVLGTQP